MKAAFRGKHLGNQFRLCPRGQELWVSWGVLSLCLQSLGFTKVVTCSVGGSRSSFNCICKGWDKFLYFFSERSKWHFHTFIFLFVALESRVQDPFHFCTVFSNFQLISHQRCTSMMPVPLSSLQKYLLNNYLGRCQVWFNNYVCVQYRVMFFEYATRD